MPLNGNSSHMAVIARRRENVGRLRLRGLSQREIITALTRVKDTDGSPDPIKASLGTVNRDLKVLEAEWRANAARDIGEHIANQLAEIAEARRKCWQLEDMAGLARFIKLEADIRGTNAPAKVELYDWRAHAAARGIDPDKVVDQVNKARLILEAPVATSDEPG